jgi:hypothetical protein
MIICVLYRFNITLNCAFFFSCGTIWNQPTSPLARNKKILNQVLSYFTSITRFIALLGETWQKTSSDQSEKNLQTFETILVSHLLLRIFFCPGKFTLQREGRLKEKESPVCCRCRRRPLCLCGVCKEQQRKEGKKKNTEADVLSGKDFTLYN